MATIAYLDIDQGSDFLAHMELENNDGTPIDLTGFAVYSQFRKSYGSVVAYNFDTQIADAPNGAITLAYSGVSSSATKPGRYLYDVEILGPLGSKLRVVQGIVTISAEITKLP